MAVVTNLPPCPFCGSGKTQINTKAKSYHAKKAAERAGEDGSNYLCRCTRCGAKGPLSHSREEAAARWAIRPDTSDIVDRLGKANITLPLHVDYSIVGSGDDERTYAFVMDANDRYLLVDEECGEDDGSPSPICDIVVEMINKLSAP